MPPSLMLSADGWNIPEASDSTCDLAPMGPSCAGQTCAHTQQLVPRVKRPGVGGAESTPRPSVPTV